MQLTQSELKYIAERVVQHGIDDANSGYQMYTAAAFNNAAAEVLKCSTDDDVIKTLVVQDFYNLPGVLQMIEEAQLPDYLRPVYPKGAEFTKIINITPKDPVNIRRDVFIVETSKGTITASFDYLDEKLISSTFLDERGSQVEDMSIVDLVESTIDEKYPVK